MIRAQTTHLQDRFSLVNGRRMGEDLIEKLGGMPDACWLFCSPKDELASLVRGVQEVLGTESLIGCTTDGEISTAGFTTDSAVLGGIISDQIEFEVVAATHISRDSEQAGKDLARGFSDSIRYVQLFSDGLTGDGSAILRGMESVFDCDIPVSGGTSADAGKFLKTWQFHGGRVVSDAAVAIGFCGDFKLGTGVRSGWTPIGLPKKVTRASGNILYELNGESALNVYERFLGKHAKNLPSVGVEYPLGLIDQFESPEGKEHLLLRATMSVVDHSDGSIQFAGEIPEGAMVYLMCGDRASILDATEDAFHLANEELGQSTEPALVFFYSCMARKALLGQHTKEELERIRAQFTSSVPVIGFYTYGEYCRLGSNRPSVLHNETATISMIGV